MQDAGLCRGRAHAVRVRWGWRRHLVDPGATAFAAAAAATSTSTATCLGIDGPDFRCSGDPGIHCPERLGDPAITFSLQFRPRRSMRCRATISGGRRSFLPTSRIATRSAPIDAGYILALLIPTRRSLNGSTTSFSSARRHLQVRCPTTGSATYDGVIQGYSDTWDNGPFPWPNPVRGTIALSFDFGAGSLSGTIHPILYVLDGSSPSSEDLGETNFKDTVFSPGATHFSGTFDTNLAGPNSFSGQFTGPNAKELMGAWTLPFVWSRDDGNIRPAG